MTIKSFFKIFIVVDIIIILFCILSGNTTWLINTQVAFFTSLLVTYVTFLSYKNIVLKNVENQTHTDNKDRDIIDKQDDPYDLYSSEINEQILEANKPIKQNHFKNLKKSFLSFVSFYRIGGYITLIVGFFYLVNNNLFDVWSYLFGFLVVPISVLLLSIKKS